MLKILQWNLENFFIDLQNPKINPQDITEDDWRNQGSSFLHQNKALFKLEAIKEVIERENPDIMVLCEIAGRASLEHFNRLFLGSNYEIHLKESRSRRGIEVGFLVKKDLGYEIKLKTNRSLNLSEDTENKKYFSRDVPELHLISPSDHVVILGVHLKSKQASEGDYMGIEKRDQEVKGILKIVNNIKEKSPLASVLIAGDFNGFLQKENTESEFESLCQSFLDYHDLMGYLKDRTSYVRIDPMTLHQLDYIMVEPNLKSRILDGGIIKYRGFYDIELDHPQTLKEKASLPSDHYPQFLTIRKIV